MKHATISAWQRQEDGGYAAEIDGWALKVVWHPEAPGKKRGFTWTAERDGTKRSNSNLFEEIEVAMSDAETSTHAATKSGPQRASGGEAAADTHDSAGHH